MNDKLLSALIVLAILLAFVIPAGMYYYDEGTHCIGIKDTEVTCKVLQVDKDMHYRYIGGLITTYYVYKISVEYEDNIYTLDNEKYFKYCKDKEGEYIKCIKRTKMYDDRSDKIDIIDIVKGWTTNEWSIKNN